MTKTFNKDQSSKIWLLIVGISTIFIGGSYTMVQQSTRLSANDAPLAKAQQVKQELNNGAQPADTIPDLKIDLKDDVNIFAIITDKNQNVLASSATSNNKTPLPPSGVFAYTSQHGSDSFSWQTIDNQHLATYVTTYKDGFIITGQSLTPFNNRIDTYGKLALVAWLATILWTSIILSDKFPKKLSNIFS